MRESYRVLILEAEVPLAARVADLFFSGRPEVPISPTGALLESIERSEASSPPDLLVIDRLLITPEDWSVLEQTSSKWHAARRMVVVPRSRLGQTPSDLTGAESLERSLRRERLAREELQRVRQHMAMLVQTSQILAGTREPLDVLPDLARLAVPRLCAACYIDIRDENGETRRVATAGADAPPNSSGSAVSPERQLTVPLLARDRTLGSMTLLFGKGDRPTAEDNIVAREIARMAALAVDNARLCRSREEVLGIVSHDLRNPLSVIAMLASRLRTESGMEEGKRSRQLDRIERAARRMAVLIRDLLDLCRIDGGGLILDHSEMEVQSLVADAIDMMRPLADCKHLELRVQMEEHLPQIRGDRDRLLQVFSNLMGNAIKFTPDGGSITVAARVAEGAVEISIRDTGTGIPVEQIGRVFDRFWQAKTGRHGVGLGLAIARGIVAGHGGTITVESGQGSGTTFSFSLPTRRSAETVDQDACSTRSPG